MGQSTTATRTTATDTSGEPAELLDVDPATLIIGANVRTDTRCDAKQFAKSIRERGVLEVITCHRDDNGALVVQRGQRRTVVAAEVGTPSGTVPVRVVPAPTEADRIVDQLTENLHREAMADAEVLAGVEQLALLGVSAAQIAKRTAIKRPDVNAAITVSGSEQARQAMTEQALSLDQAALLAEFDGDEQALLVLRDAIERGRPLAHVAQRLRDQATERAEYAAEVERHRAEGLPVLDEADAPASTFRIGLAELVDADGEAVPEDRWPEVQGAAVTLVREWVYPEDLVDDDAADGDRGPADTDADAADGAEESEPVQVLTPTWIVPDPAAAGLRHKWDGQQGAARAIAESQTDAEREQATAERRLVRENNTAWRSAETVRREWLRTLFARKSAPAGAEALIAEALLGGRYDLAKAMQHRHPMLTTLLVADAADHSTRQDARDRFATTATTPKAQTLRALGVVLAAWEDDTDVHTWRRPDAWDARIMTALSGWGYEASDVECLLTGNAPTDKADGADGDADGDAADDSAEDDGGSGPDLAA